VILTIVNTVNGGKVPIIGSKEEFIFSDTWGSYRGITWKIGLKGFSLLSLWHKLIGSGPDMFYYSLLQIPNEDLHKMIAVFGGQRLTNAHSEWITLLVNNGILGLSAFIAMTVTGIKKCLTYAKDRPGLLCVALSLISYTANNMFSFETMMNTPLFFAMLGIGMAALKEDEKPLFVTGQKEGGKKKRKAHKH
jgi:O-antigen ligase